MNWKNFFWVNEKKYVKKKKKKKKKMGWILLYRVIVDMMHKEGHPGLNNHGCPCGIEGDFHEFESQILPVVFSEEDESFDFVIHSVDPKDSNRG
jgi:hypothetical protein